MTPLNFLELFRILATMLFEKKILKNSKNLLELSKKF